MTILRAMAAGLLLGVAANAFAVSPVPTPKKPSQELSVAALDSVLNANYQAVLAVLGEPEGEQLRAAQRQWIKYRDLVCEFETMAIGAPSSQATNAQCVKRLALQRATELYDNYLTLKRTLKPPYPDVWGYDLSIFRGPGFTSQYVSVVEDPSGDYLVGYCTNYAGVELHQCGYFPFFGSRGRPTPQKITYDEYRKRFEVVPSTYSDSFKPPLSLPKGAILRQSTDFHNCYRNLPVTIVILDGLGYVHSYRMLYLRDSPVTVKTWEDCEMAPGLRLRKRRITSTPNSCCCRMAPYWSTTRTLALCCVSTACFTAITPYTMTSSLSWTSLLPIQF